MKEARLKCCTCSVSIFLTPVPPSCYEVPCRPRAGIQRGMPMIPVTILFLLLLLVIVLGLSIAAKSVTSGKGYLPDKDIVESMKASSPVDEDGVTLLGRGTKERRGGNIVLHLKGTPYEMGFQHGRLLQEEVADGVVPVFADPVASIQRFMNKPEWVKNLLRKYLELKVYGPIEKNTPRRYLEELKGIADGAGMDFKAVFIANFLSDFNMAMIHREIKKKAGTASAPGGCTSFAVSGPATSDGSLLFGRNTDYTGQGRWGAHQVVVFYEPAGEFCYVKVSTAGMIKCNSSMNEEGIVLGGHFMGYAGAHPAGLSFTILENEVMRKAGRLEDAVDIVRRARKGGAFGLLIADGKTGRAVGVEAAPERLGLREIKDHRLAMTNYALTPELKGVDLLAGHNIMMRNVAGRYRRITALIDEHFGRITPEKAAEFLGDHLDAVTGEERGTGATLCFASNVTSVVFRPKDGVFWVATGSEPACKNEYVEFDFRAELQRRRPEKSAGRLAGYAWQDPHRREGLEAYMRGIVSCKEEPRNRKKALLHLAAAMETDPHEPLYAITAARIQIHEGRYGEAVSLLAASMDRIQVPNEKAVATLLLAQVHDLEGDRQTAVEMYRRVVRMGRENKGDPFAGINDLVVGLARKGLSKPFGKKKIDTIGIMDETLE